MPDKQTVLHETGINLPISSAVDYLQIFVHCIAFFVQVAYNKSASRKEMILWPVLPPILVFVWILN